jgi:hypothetical protein
MTNSNTSQFVICQSENWQIKLDAAATCRELRQVDKLAKQKKKP